MSTRCNQIKKEKKKKTFEKWATNDSFSLHDNAPPNRALIVKNYLARHSVITLEHTLLIPPT